MTTKPPGPLPVIAIAGSTGHLGKHITATLLSPTFRSSFRRLVLFSRRAKPVPDSLEDKWSRDPKVEIRDILEAISTNISSTSSSNPASTLFRDVDVYISAIGSSGHGTKDALAKYALSPQSNVSLYIPSEFGVDHYVHDFKHPEWDQKKHHFELVQNALNNHESDSGKVKVCRIFIGLFLEDSIGPWFGFHTKQGKYESVGSPSTPISFIALQDVGNVVASVATHVPLEKVPDTLHVGGNTASVQGLVETMQNALLGDAKSQIEVSSIDLAQYKHRILHEQEVTRDPAPCLRFLMGEGKINHTADGLGNDNELVNPGEKYWKWKTVAEYAEETGGRPWADVDWPPSGSKHK